MIFFAQSMTSLNESFAAAKIVDGIARSLVGKMCEREIHYMNVIALKDSRAEIPSAQSQLMSI